MTLKALEQLVDDAATRVIPPERLADRYRAVMLGVAAGNALGLALEGMSHSAIRRHHHEGVNAVPEAERDRPWDDDLAQTAVLAEVILRTEELNPDLFAQELVRWSKENGRGIGGLTRDVIGELARGTPPRRAARDVWERTGWSNAGNGAVMRCAPVALRYRRSGAALIRNARASAVVTHFDARCEWSTAIVCVALARALADEPTTMQELAAAVAALSEQDVDPAAKDQLEEAIHHVDRADLARLALDDAMDMGYTLKAMQVVLWCVQQRGDFRSLVSGIVEAGGDTDTNGALAGAAVAASGSAGDIPGEWLAHVTGTEELIALADRLLEAAEGSA